jgi:hypothetical protein
MAQLKPVHLMEVRPTSGNDLDERWPTFHPPQLDRRWYDNNTNLTRTLRSPRRPRVGQAREAYQG